MTLTRIAVPLCFGLTVAACGGGGGTGGGGTGTAPTFDDLVAEASALSDYTETLAPTLTVPPFGTATRIRTSRSPFLYSPHPACVD